MCLRFQAPGAPCDGGFLFKFFSSFCQLFIFVSISSASRVLHVFWPEMFVDRNGRKYIRLAHKRILWATDPIVLKTFGGKNSFPQRYCDRIRKARHLWLCATSYEHLSLELQKIFKLKHFGSIDDQSNRNYKFNKKRRRLTKCSPNHKDHIIWWSNLLDQTCDLDWICTTYRYNWPWRLWAACSRKNTAFLQSQLFTFSVNDIINSNCVISSNFAGPQKHDRRRFRSFSPDEAEVLHGNRRSCLSPNRFRV